MSQVTVVMSHSTALVTDDVVIVLEDVEYQGKTVRIATAFVDGDEIPVRHLRGALPHRRDI